MRKQMATRPRRMVAAALAIALGVGGAFASGTAFAAPPKMTFSVGSSTAENKVLSGGRISYEIRVQCSNLTVDNCVNPVIKFPAPRNTDGSVVAHTPKVNSPYVASESYDAATGVLTINLKDLKPGDTRLIQVSWAVDNFTVKPGEELKTEPSVVHAAAGGGENAAQQVGDPAPAITTVTKPAVTVTKTLVSPTATNVKLGSPVVYELQACVPGSTEGMENLTQVTFTDTVTDRLGLITADNVTVTPTTSTGDVVTAPAVIQQGGQNAVQFSYTINLDGETLTRCGNGSEPVKRQVTVTYGESLLPAPGGNAGPAPTNDVTNTLVASGSTIGGTSVTGQGKVTHAFTSSGAGGVGNLITAAFKVVVDQSSTSDPTGKKVGAVLATDTETEWGWDVAGSWIGSGQSANGQRWVSYLDRLPCLVDGAAVSPGSNAGGNNTDALAWLGSGNPDAYQFNGTSLIGWGLPNKNADAPLCQNPTFRADRFYFRNDLSAPDSIKDVAAVEITYLTAAGGHESAILNFPTGLAAQGTTTNPARVGKDYAFVYVYAATAAAGAPSFNLPADATVTDFVIHYRNKPNQQNENNVAVWGTSTPAFVASGLKAQTNKESVIASSSTQATGEGKPSGPKATSTDVRSAVMQFVDESVDLTLKKEAVGGDVTNLNLGDTVTWKLTGAFNSSVPAGRQIQPAVTDVLPVGLDYVPGSTSFSGLPDGVTPPGEPTIGTKTIAGVERTTLTWKFAQDFTRGQSFVVSFDTKVGLGATPGAHSGDAAQYAGLWDQKGALPAGPNASDQYDLNGDGSVTDRVAASSVTWTVNATSGATIEKFVRGSQGSDLGVSNSPSIGEVSWSKAGVSGATIDASGTAVDYRLNVRNQSTSVLTNTVVYDVLPYVGDTAIGKDLAGQSRESQFDVKFRELLGSLPSGVTVEFSTSNNPARPELGVTGGDDNWTATVPTDATTVKALRYTVASLAPGQELNLDYRADIPRYVFGQAHPAQQTGAETEYAWNNLAFQSNGPSGALLAAEAPKVSIRSILGRIGDYAWYDLDGNGIQDPGEKPAAGVVFQLVDKDGKDVLDADGKPVTATTDANGLYHFEVPLGEWAVKVTEVPAGYYLTQPKAGDDDTVDSDIPAIGVPSHTVTIDKDNLVNNNLDAGLTKPGYTFTKSANPETGTPVKAGQTITYTLTGTNTGGLVLDPVVINDDMTQVVAFADVTTAPKAEIVDKDGNSSAAADPVVTDGKLVWNGKLAAGERVDVTYTVTVKAGFEGKTLKNKADSTATPPVGPPITPPPGETEHPIPGYTFTKSADPKSGTDVRAGQTITYTLSGVNTGATILDPVVINDDMTQVVAFADVTTAPKAEIVDKDGNSSAAADPVVTDGKLVWNGKLEIGERVDVTYTVTVKAGFEGKTLKNKADSTAKPPVVPPITPPPGETEHPIPGYTFTKTSDPESGTAVNPGGTITYTLTGTNTGATVLDPVVINDDMSKVLNHAKLTVDPVATVEGQDSVPAPVVEGTKVSWSGKLEIGQKVVITYTVTLNDDAEGIIVNNHASSSATPPTGPPITPPDVEVWHPTPGYTFNKTADPVSGSTVVAGDVITYTLTGSNFGKTVLNPVVINDDLTNVTAHATLQGEPVAKIVTANGQTDAVAPTVDGKKLAWTGTLQQGEQIVITYKVKVNEGQEGKIINNHATSTATPPVGPPITPPPGETEHPIPGYTLTKTADPKSGSTVNRGDKITYTVTGTNTGATVLDPVVVTDDLSKVLNVTTLTGAPVAKIVDADGKETVATAPTLSGTTMSWKGVLQVGEKVVITYAVTVNADAPATTINNHVESSATPPGVPPITPPPAETDHNVPPAPVVPPKPPLPNVGSTVTVGLLAAACLALLGGGVLMLRNRRRSHS